MDRTYPGAQVIRVIDGDTIVLDVDLGYNVWLRGKSYRLLGCNAREHSQAGGPEAATNLTQLLLSVGMTVTLTSVKDDKFGGRYDAQVTLPDGRDLVTYLIQTGWAAPWNGQGPKPVPAWPRLTGS